MNNGKSENLSNLKKAFLIAFSIALIAPASSCAEAMNITGITMSDPETIDVYYGNFSYEGITIDVNYRDGSSKQVPLEESMISEVERLKFFKIGEQAIEVVYRNRYKTTMNVEVLLNEFKDSYALVGYECVYDGEPHAVTLNQELPEGASISYPYGNIFINAGTYNVVGVMSKNGYASKTLEATLVIHQAEREADGIVFEDQTVVYNGEMRSIEATNIPEGVEVEYKTYDYDSGILISKVVNAGKYKVVAHFTDTSPNYAQIPDKTAILTIEKAHYDLSGIEFKDVTKVYDGLPYAASITNPQRLPNGVKVDYSYLDENGNPVENNANAGVYTMIAKFSGGALDNYYPIEDMKATLTVTHRIINIANVVTFDSKTVNFDENTIHSLAVHNLPTSVEVTYENNGQKYAGNYEIIAHFRAKDSNEAVDIDQMTAYLVINRVRRSVLSYNDVTEAYDLPFSSSNIKIQGGQASVVNIDLTTFKVVSIAFYSLLDDTQVAASALVNGTTYKFVATFEYLVPEMNDSVILSQESDNFTYEA